jgi:hypothetical protein
MAETVRIALDTNIWSYLGDANAAADFERLATTESCTIIDPPSTLLEVL